MSETSKINTTASRTEEVALHIAAGELQHIQSAYRLNGKNYLKWSQLVRTTLKGKGKASHLLGTGPKKGDPRLDAWDEEDSLVMAWMWNSMIPEISDTCMFLTTAKDIWETVRQTHSKKGDSEQVYEIKELDHYRCFETKCPDDATILKKFIEQDRVYDFLVGLNVEFDQVLVQILGKDEVPSLNENCLKLRFETTRTTFGVLTARSRGILESVVGSFMNDEHTTQGEFNKSEIEKLRALQGTLEKSSGNCSLAHSVVEDKEDLIVLPSSSSSVPSMSVSTNLESTTARDNKRLFGQEYSRQIAPSIPELVQAQESEPNSKIEGGHTLFVKHSSSGGVTVLLVYVDDIVVAGNDEKERQALILWLASEVEIKDLGKLKCFLGIEIAHSKQGIFISQQKYITDLLKETGKLACKPVSTPIEPNHKLGEAEDDIAVNKEMYQRLVGRLIYTGSVIDRRSTLVIIPSLINSDSSEVTMALTRKVPMISNVWAAEGARISGATSIIGVDLNPTKRFGVTEFVNPKDFDKPVQQVLGEMTDGGVDLSIECTGNVDTMIFAFECVHNGWGVAVLGGVPNKDGKFKIHPMNILNERTLKGTFFGNYKPRTDLLSFVEST
ncbi:alcohol dehydrogenase 1 [Actinidia rufa]|uniref:alcohol dehydrogenase n=1 Tax=Actinidia rufa TaxID=165716 RepID=A0A7J0FCW0_9ERIC|nr:alcohol dehydrogenase 1 [Actinidia rufa]